MSGEGFTATKAIALVVFLGAVAGATYAVQSVLRDEAWEDYIVAGAVDDELATTRGQSVTFAVTLFNAGDLGRDLRVELSDDAFAGASAIARVPSLGNFTVFLTGSVPADATPGPHDLSLRIQSAEGKLLRERAGFATLTVLDPDASGDAYALGDVGNVTYSAWFTEAETLVRSNDPTLASLPLPRSGLFEATPHPAFLHGRDLPPGVAEGAVGMRVGESRTIVVPDAFGPARQETSQERDSQIQLETTIRNSEQTRTREEFEALIRSSDQGDPADYVVGETFLVHNNVTGNDLRHVILQSNGAVVVSRLALEPGEKVTLYLAWPNQTEVIASDTTSLRLRTTPNTEPGDPITMFDQWPQMSTILSANNTTVIVRHSPPVGHEFTGSAPEGYQTDFRVTRVTDDEIFYSYRVADELAGKSVTYHVRLDALVKRT